MRHNCLTQGRAGTRQNLEHTWRQTGRVRQFTQFKRGEWRKGGRLENNAIPGSECRRSLPARDRERKIPWNDTGHDAHRLAQGKIESTAADGNSLTAEF